MHESRVPGHSTSLSQGRLETPVSSPTDESGLKPSLATTHAKASRRVIAGPLSSYTGSKSHLSVSTLSCATGLGPDARQETTSSGFDATTWTCFPSIRHL